MVDDTAVSIAAIQLWTAQGFAATGWRELADATGISVRTLIRHYSERSAIFWSGVPLAAERLRTALAAADPTAPLADVLRTAVLASMAPPTGRLGAQWARLIESEPELAASAHRAYRPWRDALADYLSDRLPQAPPSIPLALAAAYESASHTALVQWVASGAGDDPSRAVDEALRWLGVFATAHTVDT
ncbi:TetR family transcriptional regulator [Cellulomonas sp. NPDC089187]|uniref:TetR/AcrR family transcriptional regulator n=1 Tax=Cellulomonas sp. NPDC089187 TaxID=3154970 RepID=UPI003428AC95